MQGKTRDRNKRNIHLQDIRDRGKIPRDADNLERELTPVINYIVNKFNIILKNQISKHPLLNTKNTFFFNQGRQKNLKKTPPYVDERVKNARGRMERKMEFVDRKVS